MPDGPNDPGGTFSLAGRVAVVTGASRGIGAAIAAGLARAGAQVFGLSRSAPKAGAVVQIACDLADRPQVTAAFERIGREAARVDILVNAAALSLPPSAPDRDAEVARFEETLAIDLVAPFACILAARPLMGKGASIINITSINSVMGFPGNPGYVAAKAGLAGLTRALAVDLAADGIRVNAIAPGYVRTAMTEAGHADPVRFEERRRQTVLGRWGAPEDIVGAAIYLASRASAYVTGQELFVDGGWTVNGLPHS